MKNKLIAALLCLGVAFCGVKTGYALSEGSATPPEKPAALDKYEAFYRVIPKLTESDYGGFYFTGDKLKILATDEEKVREIAKKSGVSDYTEVEAVENSIKELSAIRTRATKLMRRYENIASVGIDQKNNRVRVELVSYNEAENKKIQTELDSIAGPELIYVKAFAPEEYEDNTPLSSSEIMAALRRGLSSADYGGIYMRGDEVIVLSVDVEAVLKVINDNDFGDAVGVLPAKYSVNQLKSAHASLERVMDKYDISSVYTAVKENRVQVVTQKHSNGLSSFIKSLKNGGCIEVMGSEKAEEPVQDTMQK